MDWGRTEQALRWLAKDYVLLNPYVTKQALKTIEGQISSQII
jgi:hypothetical protein